MFSDNDYRKIATILDEYKNQENVMLCEFMMFLKEKNLKLEDVVRYISEQEQNSLMVLLLVPILEVIKKRWNLSMELANEFINE